MKTLGHGVADSLSGEEIQQTRQINKSRYDPNVGNIGDPSLIDSSNLTVLQKIGIERVTMIALGGPNPFLQGTTKQIIGSHDLEDFLMVDLPTIAMKLGSHPPVALAGETPNR